MNNQSSLDVQRLVGKTIEQAAEILKGYGITKIDIAENFVNPMPNSTLLVLSVNLKNNSATLIVGSFKLDV